MLEYDGAPFVGWQTQPNGLSVQTAIEAAIEKFCGYAVRVQAAGRTDAGVHAKAQVIHFDLNRDWPAPKVRDAINHHLRPAPVCLIECEAVTEGFEARFSATARHYQYCIINRPAPAALMRNRAWHVARPLDVAAMHEAAATILGHHDFTTFRSSACQANSPLRTLDRLEVVRDGEQVWIKASARSFLHNQVRSLVGSLKLVGLGKWPVGALRVALDKKDRAACGPVAPAHGLYLVAVDYPEF
ncbi:MAG: tRNA pseudouridine(38-40) synthase TruA [Alphaproteobacteria bacterium]|nr:tRNA pseudouridine(38-40) synthase TruA [Alphaproteobacteria bacterium]